METLRHRYDRQNLIKDWDQKKIAEGVVTVIGSGPLAMYTALPLAALGVGQLRIIDAVRAEAGEQLLDIPLSGARAKSLAQALHKINPEISVIGIESSLESRTAEYFLRGSSAVIDASNSIRSKTHAAEYASSAGMPLISASAGNCSGKISASGRVDTANLARLLLPMYDKARQDPLISLELGAVIAEEAKKILMGGQELLPRIYNYNLAAADIFSKTADRSIDETMDAFKDKNILIVGAGALGCFLGPAAVQRMRPGHIDVMDYDTVEEHNLNRQVCFYDAIGKHKAERLAGTMKAMSRGTGITAMVDKFTKDFEAGKRYDLILDAVDSFFTKAILHNYALENRIPIISGGTDYRAATVLVYKPGVTSCLDCQVNLNELAVKAEIIRRTSCLLAPNPSVIMTNQIAAALMVGEAMRVLRPDQYGEPVNGEIKYISDFESRGGVSRLEEVCQCQEAKQLDVPDLSRVKIEERMVNGELVKEIYVDNKRI